MKILLVTQYFWPETFRINDLALELHQRGCEVEVLTGKPNYPQGKIYEGYGFFSHNKDVYNGIKIHRVPLFPRGSGSGLRLVLNYLSYIFFACFFILFSRKKYDVTLTFAISPITQIYPALLHKKVYGSKAVLWVQDLWPESVMAAGKVGSAFIMKRLDKMVTNIYHKTDKILVQSEAFIPSVRSKGVKEDKIYYIPNWAEDLFLSTVSKECSRFAGLIPQGFIVMFAGNIGEAQDFESILKASELTKHIVEIKWVIVGDGRKKNWFEDKIREKEMEKTVFLLGRYPVEDMPDFFACADVMLLTLKDDAIFSQTIPSKLQSYMAFGKPIVSMLNGITNDLIVKSDCGYIANATNYEQLATNILIAHKTSQKHLLKKGENGKNYYQKYFSKNIVINNILNIFQEL